MVAQTKPKPQSGESESDFMSRCVPMLIDEGKPQPQAVAICTSMWAEKVHGPKPQPGETEDRFIARCVPMLIESENIPQAHATTLCANIWITADDIAEIDWLKLIS